MRMILKLLVTVALACIQLSQVTEAKQNHQSYEWLTNLDDQNLDPSIVELLHDKLSKDEFKARILDHYKTMGVKIDFRDGTDLHLLYSTLMSFSQPCSREISFVLDMVDPTYNHMIDEGLKKIYKFMLDKKPAHVYADKCVNEFDSLAAKMYSNDEDAVDLMSKLSKSISPETRKKMYYNEIKQNINALKATTPDNGMINVIKESKELCEKTLNNPDLQVLFSIFRDILWHTSNLHHDGLSERLSKQIDEEGPNAIKLISLATFCSKK